MCPVLAADSLLSTPTKKQALRTEEAALSFVGLSMALDGKFGNPKRKMPQAEGMLVFPSHSVFRDSIPVS